MNHQLQRDAACRRRGKLLGGLLGAVLALLACAAPARAGGEVDPYMSFWIDADYLNFWTQGAPVPALVTTGPLTNPVANTGALGQPDTQILAGNGRINQASSPGFRISTGMWLTPSESLGVEGTFFYLTPQTRTDDYVGDAGGTPVIARPVTDVVTGAETSLLASAPTAFTGDVSITTRTALLGADTNLILPLTRGQCWCDESYFFNLLGGFRYLDLREDLIIGQQTTVLANGISFFNGQPELAGSSFQLNDSFHTLNQFYGGQVGAKAGFDWWIFTFTGTGKVAVGTCRQEVGINGSTTFYPVTGGTLSNPGGLLALPSNIGVHDRNVFAVVPELGATVSVAITSQIKMTVGYTLIYLSDAARPGDQIDRGVNRLQLPTSQAYNPSLGTPARPAFQWSGSDFWAQGFNIGLGLRF